MNANIDGSLRDDKSLRLRRRDILKENERRLGAKRASRLLVVLVATLLATAGCSGGGGGVLGVSPQVDKVLEEGWHNLRNGVNDVSIMRFREVLEGAPDTWEESSAFTGLGWSYANINDPERSVAYFAKVQDKSNDANVGYAGVLLNRGAEGDYALALKLLKNIHMDNLDQHYNSENRIDVSDAEVHALMAIACFYNGNRPDAARQIRKAKDLDTAGTNETVNRVYRALIDEFKVE